MNFNNVVLSLSLSATLVGCCTIFSAREAQKAVRERAVGCVREKGAAPDLADCSLRELVEYALTNRPSMVSAALAVADARLALWQIAADAPLLSCTPWASPKIGVSGGYSANSAADTRLKWRTDGSASAGISLDLLLYDFGRHEAKAGAQVETVIAAECSYLQQGYAVFEEVASAYFDLMRKDALLLVAQTNEFEYAERLRQAQHRFDAGEAKRLDVTSAKLDLSQAREDTIVASNNMVKAGAEMMRALGIDASRGTRDEIFPANDKALAEVMRGFAATHYDVASAFELARTNAPAMAIARARLRAASRQVDFAVADLMPSVSAQVGISWADPLWAWHWGVSAAQSVFEGFRRTTAVDRAVVQMHSAAAAVDEEEQRLSLHLQEAIATRDNAIKALDTARASVANALENLNTAKEQFHEGDVSRVDFTIAIGKYAAALGTRVDDFYAWQVAEARLFAILGKLPEYDEKVIKEK